MSSERWRCFVAVPIGEALRAELRAAVDGWRGDMDLRWVDPDGWHVTLAFLGSIPAASVPALVERLVAAAVANPVMSVRTGGIGAFPAPARARVAWYAVRMRGAIWHASRPTWPSRWASMPRSHFGRI